MSYKTSHYVANLCVHATSDSQKPIVVIFPHEAHLRDALANAANNNASAGLRLPAPDTDIHTLCTDRAVRAFYLRDMQIIAKKNGFRPIEVVQGVVLTPDEWTPESGLVTAAQKVQRKAVERKFWDEIKVRSGSSIVLCGTRADEECGGGFICVGVLQGGAGV
jgi:long-chain acyl-CoA synthetase